MGSARIFPKRLKEARLRAGLSQKKLGILAGVDEFAASTRINYYELDKNEPKFLMVERIAEVLGAPTPYFYARDDELAAWILAFDKLSRRTRQAILKEADRR